MRSPVMVLALLLLPLASAVDAIDPTLSPAAGTGVVRFESGSVIGQCVFAGSAAFHLVTDGTLVTDFEARALGVPINGGSITRFDRAVAHCGAYGTTFAGGECERVEGVVRCHSNSRGPISTSDPLSEAGSFCEAPTSAHDLTLDVDGNVRTDFVLYCGTSLWAYAHVEGQLVALGAP